MLCSLPGWISGDVKVVNWARKTCISELFDKTGAEVVLATRKLGGRTDDL